MSGPLKLPLLAPGDAFPPPSRAWPAQSQAPGLLAAGGQLDVHTLRAAYEQGIFPWFGNNEPILWWSTDPRMVLQPEDFRLRRSLRKRLRQLLGQGLEISFDGNFDEVIDACALKARPHQAGTWIVPEIRRAYKAFHRAGYAHSIELRQNGQLQAGLYCVVIGHAVFGESMFTHISDGSKIALAALVGWCKKWHIPLIDCQQNTKHLASLGAAEISRARFIQIISQLTPLPSPPWQFDIRDWQISCA